ncbi:MAG: ATP-binding protein [Microbacterium sp.]
MGSGLLDSTQITIIALAAGLVLGAGIATVLAVSFRTRERVVASQSTIVPEELIAALPVIEDATAVIDQSGIVVFASASAARIGLSEGEIPVQPELREVIKTVRHGGADQSETLRIRRGRFSDDTRLVNVHVARIAQRLTLLTVRDITSEERLQQMRQDFIANTSHELKTPVGAIQLLAEALEQAADDPEQVRRFAGRVGEEVERLGELVSRIMDLSRLQADDDQIDMDVVAIDDVVSKAVDRHRVQAESAQVVLVSGGDKKLFVHGSKTILVDAVSNLITNAIAYSPEGSRVGVGVRGTDDAVEIAVTDQGIGIAESDQNRVFERFYRADQARSRRTGGTGLGLAIVKHAVSRHGGDVRLWSQPDRGSTFTIRLPRLDSRRAAAELRQRQQKNKKKHQKSTQKDRAVSA